MKPVNLKLIHSNNKGNGAGPDSQPGMNRSDAVLPLELVDVGFQVGQESLLRDINLSFHGSNTSVLLGPNGAGKTLLLRICHGLLQPTTGHVRWRDPALAMRPDGQGMVFQKPVVLRRSVKANIEFALKVCKVTPSLYAVRTAEALSASGLAGIADPRATHLSGGEQQRLALARCLAIRPRVLFLDEPTAHLDPAATGKVEEMIRLIREMGTRVIMVTHDIAQARRLAGEIVFMHQGGVCETGPADAFFQCPRSREAAAYLAGELLW